MGLTSSAHDDGVPRLRRTPAFVRFWVASTVSDVGTYLTTVALSVLVLVVLGGTAIDQGSVNAARWAPYLAFGLLAGIWIDRLRARTVLVAVDVGRAVVLTALAGLALTGALTIPWTLLLMLCFGTLALMGDAASQSILPHLVPRDRLVHANARLQQSTAVAQTTGGALAGALVAVVGAPVALLLDAVSYLISGIVLHTLRRHVPPSTPRVEGGPVIARVAEGLRWVYRHTTLTPLAVASHVWFVGSSMVAAVFPVLILTVWGLGPLALGVALGCAGGGAVLGTSVSRRIGERWPVGRVLTTSFLLQTLPLILMALAPLVTGSPTAGSPSPTTWPPSLVVGFLMAALGQFLVGFSMGVDGPIEMAYWQAVTPDRLLARMSATRRSANRGMIVIGAPLGGYVAITASLSAALWTAAGLTLVAGVILARWFRSARLEPDDARAD